ncbi:hypothetical protein Taro_016858 [Colocasia esculenta]|uniref:Uncharacterized protein n=1 Tax=Colocasia esculenta TaxID=4460 RepID=A0A843URF9_COLES|nr:hypothetical protein [Colocasia esculenta]
MTSLQFARTVFDEKFVEDAGIGFVDVVVGIAGIVVELKLQVSVEVAHSPTVQQHAGSTSPPILKNSRTAGSRGAAGGDIRAWDQTNQIQVYPDRGDEQQRRHPFGLATCRRTTSILPVFSSRVESPGWKPSFSRVDSPGWKPNPFFFFPLLAKKPTPPCHRTRFFTTQNRVAPVHRRSPVRGRPNPRAFRLRPKGLSHLCPRLAVPERHPRSCRPCAQAKPSRQRPEGSSTHALTREGRLSCPAPLSTRAVPVLAPLSRSPPTPRPRDPASLCSSPCAREGLVARGRCHRPPHPRPVRSPVRAPSTRWFVLRRQSAEGTPTVSSPRARSTRPQQSFPLECKKRRGQPLKVDRTQMVRYSTGPLQYSGNALSLLSHLQAQELHLCSDFHSVCVITCSAVYNTLYLRGSPTEFRSATQLPTLGANGINGGIPRVEALLQRGGFPRVEAQPFFFFPPRPLSHINDARDFLYWTLSLLDVAVRAAAAALLLVTAPSLSTSSISSSPSIGKAL